MYIGAVVAYLIPHFSICLKTLKKTNGHPASVSINELSTFRYKALSSAVQL